MYFILLFALSVNIARGCEIDSNSPYIIIDGCPERNVAYDSQADPNPKECRNWEACHWDMGMCPSCDGNGTQGPTRSVRTARPSDRPSNEPSKKPSDSPSQYPTFITIQKITPPPSEMPSDGPSAVPSDRPSDTPSQYPTYISTSKVRCPSARLVNSTSKSN